MKTKTMLSFFIFLYLPLASIQAVEKDLIVWKFKTSAAIHSAPLIEDSVLYIGSTNNIFYAINIKSGTEIWQFTTDYSINSKAATNDSLVIFESGFKLYALTKKTGTLKWSYVADARKPEMSLGLTDYHHSSPIIYKDIAYYGDGWGNLNGVDIKSGKLRFQYTIRTDSAAIRTTPVIKDNAIYFGDWAGHVYAVSLSDKSLLWQYTLKNRRAFYGMVTSDMVIHDTLLFFGSQHDVFSPLGLKSGKPAWTFIDPNKSYLPSTPIFYKNSVIIGSTINTFKIYCLTDGKVTWSCKSDGIFFVQPVIVDSVIIMNTSFFGGNGTIYMVDGNNGSIINEYHIINASPTSPALGDQKLFIGNGDGFLYALNLNELIYSRDKIQEEIH
jgi:eukaryotic-like serine/threonine-protein kinase